MNLINKANCRKLALEFSRDYRSNKFKRVSNAFLIELQNLVWEKIEESVKNHPTKGQTITELK